MEEKERMVGERRVVKGRRRRHWHVSCSASIEADNYDDEWYSVVVSLPSEDDMVHLWLSRPQLDGAVAVLPQHVLL